MTELEKEIVLLRGEALEGRIPKTKATERLGELYACKVLKLETVHPGTKGFDATDESGMRYQVKGRSPSLPVGSVDPAGRIGVFHTFDFDHALLVCLDGQLNLDRIWQLDCEAVKVLQEKERTQGIHVSSFTKHARGIFPN